MTRYQAATLCEKYEIDVTKNFFALSAFEVECVLAAANERRYRKPKMANGSRGRYFFHALQRALTPKPFSGFVPKHWTAIDKYNHWISI